MTTWTQTNSPANSVHSGPTSTRVFWLGAILLALVFAILTVLTWRRWGDMVVDFGVQLYLPWKLSTGAVLYRDVAYLTGGPLSQYYHALLFKLFGVSILTIVESNLAIVALLVALVYWRFYKDSDAFTAVMVGLAILLVFAFANYTEHGIFNYVTPYSHEIVHGLVLSIVALVALSKWLVRGSLPFASLAGFCLGLVLLTKPEIFLALVLALAAAFYMVRQTGWRFELILRSLAVMAAAALIPLLGFFIYFSRVDSFSDSVRSVFWAWTPLLTRSPADNYFYQWCMGLVEPGHHFAMIVGEFFGLTAVVALLAAAFRLAGGTRRALIVFVIGLVLIVALGLNFHWGTCGYCLPLSCLALLGILAWRWRKEGHDQAAVFPILWTVFSLGLLAKLGLFTRIWHYGFVLAMPAFVAVVYLLLWQLPQVLGRFRVPRVYLQCAMGLLLLVGYGELMADTQYVYDKKTVSVGRGGDRLLTFRPGFRPMGVALGQTLEWMATNLPPQATLAVLPEGVMINYLSRRTNPTGYIRWNMAESAVFGQNNMDQAFIKNAPDYVLLIQLDGREFAVKPFGEEERFGLELVKWINFITPPSIKSIVRRCAF